MTFSPPFEILFGTCSSTSLKKSQVSSTNFQDKFQFVKSVKHSVFDLTKISFLKCLISTYLLIVEFLNDQNLFTELNLGELCSSDIQFYLGGHFLKQSAAAR